jgi:hypothetical protein
MLTLWIREIKRVEKPRSIMIRDPDPRRHRKMDICGVCVCVCNACFIDDGWQDICGGGESVLLRSKG